jgi:uncharacterized protein (DUF362 family)
VLRSLAWSPSPVELFSPWPPEPRTSARKSLLFQSRATVSLVRGEDRRRNVYNALLAIDDQIRPALKRKKYVLLKPNTVAVNNQLGSTHVNAIRGILDYLSERYRGPVVIADSSKDCTWDAYENFLYNRVLTEYRPLKVSFVDLNEDPRPLVHEIVDRDLHLTQVRLASRLFDPEAYILGCAILKAHDNVVATLSVKNLVMAAPLHNARSETAKWHDKARYHQGYRQIQMNIALTAKRMRPFWGATVIDGFEGNGRRRPSPRHPRPFPLSHRVHGFCCCRPRWSRNHGCQTPPGPATSNTAVTPASANTTSPKSTFAAPRRYPRSEKPTSFTPESTSRSNGSDHCPRRSSLSSPIFAIQARLVGRNLASGCVPERRPSTGDYPSSLPLLQFMTPRQTDTPWPAPLPGKVDATITPTLATQQQISQAFTGPVSRAGRQRQ